MRRTASVPAVADGSNMANAYYKQSRRTRSSTKGAMVMLSSTRKNENSSPVSPLQFCMDGARHAFFASSMSPGSSDYDENIHTEVLVDDLAACDYCHHPGLLLDCANVISNREKLRSYLDTAQGLHLSLIKSDQTLKAMSYRLFDDEESSVTVWQSKCTTVHDLADLALAQAVDFVKNYDAEHDLKRAVASGPKGTDTQGYVYKMELLEEAINIGTGKTKSCVALNNLQQAVQILSHSCLVDKAWKLKLERVVKMLQRVQESIVFQNNDLELLEVGHRHLERLWKTILSQNGMIIPLTVSIPSSKTSSENALKPPPPPPPLPPHLVLTLRDIIDKLASTGRVKACIDAYTDIRASKASESLQTVCPVYLNFTTPDSIDNLEWLELEQHIILWRQHLDVFIKVLLRVEHELCRQVFSSAFQSSTAWKPSFVHLCMRAGLESFFQFAEAVGKSNQMKEAEKLFELLDMVVALQSNRPALEELMGTENGCRDAVQRLDDVKSWLVRTVSKAFRHFRFQVDLQILDNVPLDGRVLDLCNGVIASLSSLICDRHMPTLKQAVMLEQCERGERSENFGLADAVRHMLKSLERRIDACGKAMEDEVLCQLFLMNNYWHVYTSLSTNRQLAALVGDGCLKDYKQKAKEHAHRYQREGWASILQHLTNREPAAAAGTETTNTKKGGASVRANLELQKVRAFQVAFEGSYRKHKGWKIPDSVLRERIGNAVVRLVVPAYRMYLDGFKKLMRLSKSQVQLKYSVDMMQQMLTCLFKEKLQEVTAYSSPRVFYGDGSLRKSRSINGLDHMLHEDGFLYRSYSTNNLESPL